MRVFLISIFLTVPLLAQQYFNASEAELNLADDSRNLAQNTQNPPAASPGGSDGFAGTPWGSTFSAVKASLKNLATSSTSPERVEIMMEERNKYILVRRNDVLYRYSFYKTPLEVVNLKEQHQKTPEEYDQEEAVLFHVKVLTPFIDASQIRAKLEQAMQGPATKSTVDARMRGAAIWETPSTLVFQWYEPYRNKAFTRTIDYLSKDLSKKIMTEYGSYFDAKERAILRDMLAR